MKQKLPLIVSLLLFITGFIQAQTESDTSLVHIETTDGNEYVGKIVGQDSTKIFLKTDNLGKIYIYKSDIKSREYINKEQIKDNGLWFASSPLININGMLRIANRGYLLTENYYIKTEYEKILLISLGGRWIIKKAALDFGIVIPFVEQEEFFGIPWLGFTIPFGNTH